MTHKEESAICVPSNSNPILNLTSFAIRPHSELLEADEEGRNDVVAEMAEIAVLRGLSDAVVVHRPRAPHASPVAKPGVLAARVVANRAFG